jgi:hypothetical protein
MIRFIGTSLQLNSITTDHTLNSFWTTSVWRISMKDLWLLSESLISDWSLLNLNLSLSLMLRLTVSRPVCPGIKRPSGAYDQIFITVRQLRVCWFGAGSLTRGRVCRLQLLLALASAVIFWSESHRTCGHILLSQIRDFPFRRLLQLTWSRWRYSTPSPHGYISINALPFIAAWEPNSDHRL